MSKLPLRKIKIVIAEHNVQFRDTLQLFLKPLENFEVVGVANDGLELVELNFTLKPDLLLMDIHMPNLDGINAYKECVKTNPKANCIFITAYDDFAIEAFELNALDYIVKPFEKNRLYLALDRAYEKLQRETEITKRNKQLHLKRLLVKFDGTLYIISLNSIIFIEKVNRKTYVHTKEQIYETYETLEAIKESLDEHFFASHRSYIINLKHISQVKSDGETYFAYFSDYLKFAHISKWKIHGLQKTLKELM